jgi:hypothetical protein
MTVRRFSGKATVVMQLNRKDEYVAWVIVEDVTSVMTITQAMYRVAPPKTKTMTCSIDAPEAFDSAARAAIGFALEEKDQHGISTFDSGDFAFTDDAVYVSRSRSTPWPEC